MACSSERPLRPLPRSFFIPAADIVAPRLLGKLIVRRTAAGEQRARVVETEAYTGALDRAAHAARGLTPRTAVLYGEPGRAYVYFIYGMHWCLNVSTREAGEAGGVLFRAAQLLTPPPAPLAGPGRLTRALGITGALNGGDLTRPGELFLAADGCTPRSIAVTTRIGIRHARELPYRFFVEGASAVTAPRGPVLARLAPR